MSVQEITTDELRRMSDQEGLVVQGCGGDLQEWVDGINEMLAVDGVFKKGAGFQEAYSFKRGGVTCLLFPLCPLAAPRTALCCSTVRITAIIPPFSTLRYLVPTSPTVRAPHGRPTSKTWAGTLPGTAALPIPTIPCTALSPGAATEPAPPATPLTGM